MSMAPQAEMERVEIGTERPHDTPEKMIGFRWLVIISITALVLSIVLPLVTQLNMRVDFRAISETSNQWEGVDTTVLAGSQSEAYVRTVSTEYKAIFIPLNLSNNAAQFTPLMVLYGPVLITGQPLEIGVIPEAFSSELVGSAAIRLAHVGGPAVFYILLLFLLVIMDLMLKSPQAVLKFVLILSLLWLGYSLIMWLIGGWMIAPLKPVFLNLLAERQGIARYTLDFTMTVLGPAVRIFFVGILYWVLSFMLKRARSDQPLVDFAAQKGTRP
jgi:hypothetical protein